MMLDSGTVQVLFKEDVIGQARKESVVAIYEQLTCSSSGPAMVLTPMTGTAVPISVNDDARMPAFEMSSGAAYGFVHEQCRSQKIRIR